MIPSLKYFKTHIWESNEGKNKSRRSLFSIRYTALNLRKKYKLDFLKTYELLTHSLVNLQSKSIGIFFDESDFL